MDSKENETKHKYKIGDKVAYALNGSLYDIVAAIETETHNGITYTKYFIANGGYFCLQES
ncbi:MAG: hypothetical protein IKP49_02485 [Treponema sp.]|nr:hypothetical protein [Treponema sp.]